MKLPLTLAFWAWSSLTLWAQIPLHLQLISDEGTDDAVSIHVVVENGSGDLLSMQGTLNYNAQVLIHTTVSAGDIVGLNTPLTSEITPGELGFSWLTDNGVPVQFSVGDTLFTASFVLGNPVDTVAEFDMTSSTLPLEFIGDGFAEYEVTVTGTSTDYTASNETAASAFRFSGTSTADGLNISIDLIAETAFELLSCQGTISFLNDLENIQSIESSLLENLDLQDATIQNESIAWSWYSPSVEPLAIDSGETILSVTGSLQNSTDSVTVSLDNSILSIEFIGLDFEPFLISTFTQTVSIESNPDVPDCVNCALGCTYPGACNYDEAATLDNGSCLFPNVGYDCSGNCLLDLDQDGVCDLEETFGCTYPSASNFNPSATEDNGFCVFQSSNTCPTDVDGDGLTGVSDILEVLSWFSYQCPQ